MIKKSLEEFKKESDEAEKEDEEDEDSEAEQKNRLIDNKVSNRQTKS
nr:hypothetical protein [Mycoplasmopsis bovis]